MNLDAISRAANENTDPDPSDRDFGELMANALRVCLDDLLANRGPMTDDQRKAKPWWKSAKDWGGKEAEEYASKGFMGKAIDFMDELASTGMMGTAMGGGGAVKTAKPVKPAPKPPTRPVVPGQDQPPKESDPAPKMPQITPAMLERLRKRIAGE